MSLDSLSNAEKTVIKALAIKGGSTSETITYGFVTGDLKAFDSSEYKNFFEAWDRLDDEQKEAVIKIRFISNLGNHDPDLGTKIIPSRDSFVDDFIMWKIKQEISFRAWHLSEEQEQAQFSKIESEVLEGLEPYIYKRD